MRQLSSSQNGLCGLCINQDSTRVTSYELKNGQVTIMAWRHILMNTLNIGILHLGGNIYQN